MNKAAAGVCGLVASLLVPAVALAGGQAGKAQPTFAKDVAPILYKNCVECHRATMFAPMSLMTYDEVRPWAREIGRAHV